MAASSKSDYFESEPYVERDTSYSSSEGRPGLGKFFGLTGTTSQNIQVHIYRENSSVVTAFNYSFEKRYHVIRFLYFFVAWIDIHRSLP